MQETCPRHAPCTSAGCAGRNLRSSARDGFFGCTLLLEITLSQNADLRVSSRDMQLRQELNAEPVAQPPSAPAPQPSRVAPPRAIEWIAVGAMLWMLAACLQWKVGAFAVEFGSNADESAHYITGLMIRDYIVSIISGHFTSPLAYAENYYVHYPKVSIGMWPPLFHLTEAIWGLIVSPARVPILLLMALITASIGTSIYLVLRRRYPMAWAFAGGALFVISPLVQLSTQAVMADGLVALLDFWAMIFLIRYMERERGRDALLFGLFAGLSMATKANGVALVLLPLLAMLITWHFHPLRTRWLYYSAAIVLVLGVPWQVLSYYLIYRSHGLPQTPLAYRLHLGNLYGLVLLGAVGWVFAAFFLLGLAIFLFRLWRRQPDTTLACALALFLSVWIYHSALGFGENRWILGALPPAILFVVAGFAWFERYISSHAAPVAARLISLAALAVGIFALQPWAVPRKPHLGFDQPAHFLLSNAEFSHGNFLVVSNPPGEGAFISEVAMHERRPTHIILRCSKFLEAARGTARTLNCVLRRRQSCANSLTTPLSTPWCWIPGPGNSVNKMKSINFRSR